MSHVGGDHWLSGVRKLPKVPVIWWWIRLIRFIWSALGSGISVTRWTTFKLFLSQPFKESSWLSNRYYEWKSGGRVSQYFPADQITDHPERFLVSEMIRGRFFIWLAKRFSFCRSSGRLYEAWWGSDKDSYPCNYHGWAEIAQKGIIIGKGGAMLQENWDHEKRRDIELMLVKRRTKNEQDSLVP